MLFPFYPLITLQAFSLCGCVTSGRCFLNTARLLHSRSWLGLDLWLVLDQAEKVTQKHHDGDFAHCGHVNRRLVLDIRVEVLPWTSAILRLRT